MKELFKQIMWQFLILHKNNLIYVSIAVTVIYALIFYLVKDLDEAVPFLTLLIFNDPAIIGLFFVGLCVIIEKNEAVLPAIFVTPINYHTYLLSRIIALSVLGWACATGMTVSMMGFDLQWLEFSVGTFGTCLIFSLAGIFLVSYTTEFLNYLLKSIPILVLLSLPLFNYFGLTDTVWFKISPIEGPLNLIIHSMTPTEGHSIYWDYLSTALWIPLLYVLVYKVFTNRLVKAF